MSTQHTIDTVATILNVSEQRVRTLCREGILRAHKIGVSWLIDEKSLDEYQAKAQKRIGEDHPIYRAHGSQPIGLSFFTGAMGLDLGLERAGIELRLACEIDKYSRQTIALNRPQAALIGDIHQYSADEILHYAGLSRSDDLDLIIGGPPCQAFSTAGKRNGFNDQRGNVFLRYLDIALDLRPKFIVIENVRGLLSSPMNHRPHHLRGEAFPPLSFDELAGGALYFVLQLIEQAGYGVSFQLYNAANFGSPQIRERVVIICSRDGKRPPFLSPTHAENGDYGLAPWKTFREATHGIETHHHINFPEKRLTFYRLLKEGQNWRALPAELQETALGKAYHSGGGKTGFLRRLHWDKPAPTLVTHPAMPATDLAHPVEDRPLSVEEYKRLQEFPDDWEFAGPLLEQYRQIGNAVPMSLGLAIGTLVMTLLRNESPTAPPVDFPYSRYRHTTDEAWKKRFLQQTEQEQVVQ